MYSPPPDPASNRLRTKANGAGAGATPIFLHTWGSCGYAPTQFRWPRGVTVSLDGIVVVIDKENHCIQCFRGNGEFVRKWGRQGSGKGEFMGPLGVSVGVSDAIRAAILEALHNIPEASAFPPGLGPMCADYVGYECIYVADTFNHRIQVFEMNGRHCLTWGTVGGDDGQFNNPSGCCVANKENVLYVADTYNHRIQAFHADGRFIRKWGSRGHDASQFAFPMSVSVSDTGRIYVADTLNRRIVCYRYDGTYDGEFCKVGHNPISVVVDDDNGVVYVVETYNNYILQYGMVDGTVLHKIGGRGDDDGRLSYPTCIAKGPDGILYVTDAVDSRVVAWQVDAFDS